jgi:hypothetical protein
MSGASAVVALLPYANLSRRHDAGVVIARLAPLAARVHAYELARADLETMTAIVDGIVNGVGA